MRTRILGLTGQSGAGKTTVSRYLAGLPGFFVIDADQVAREVAGVGMPCLEKLREAFGEEILLPSGELDRRKLAGIVFSDPSRLATLNAVTLPFITRRIDEQIESLRGHYRCVVLDAPTLFESGPDVRRCRRRCGRPGNAHCAHPAARRPDRGRGGPAHRRAARRAVLYTARGVHPAQRRHRGGAACRAGKFTKSTASGSFFRKIGVC